MMNKLFLYTFVLLFAISLVFAAGGQQETPGNLISPNTGAENSQDSDIGNGSVSGQHEVEVQTMNKGESSQLKVKTDSEFGATIQSGDGKSEAKTSMTMKQEQNKTYAQLSNGKNAEIKVMPDSASQRALEVLGAKCEERGCEMELKEVGKGDETKAAYEVQAKKEVKVLGFIKSQMRVQAQIDAENGEVIKTKNAWWGFLAKKNLE